MINVVHDYVSFIGQAFFWQGDVCWARQERVKKDKQHQTRPESTRPEKAIDKALDQTKQHIVEQDERRQDKKRPKKAIQDQT